MADFQVGEYREKEPIDQATVRRNTRVGLWIFSVYATAYIGFILGNAFFPADMERKPIAGINVALLYGFSLIVGSFVVAFLYGWLCRAPAASDASEAKP